MLTTVDSTSPIHGEDHIEDEEVISPPASAEIDDVDDNGLEAFAEDEGNLCPLSLEHGEEDDIEAIEEYRGEDDGEAIEEFHEEGEGWDMDVDAAGGLHAGVKGPVSL